MQKKILPMMQRRKRRHIIRSLILCHRLHKVFCLLEVVVVAAVADQEGVGLEGGRGKKTKRRYFWSVGLMGLGPMLAVGVDMEEKV
jgi:hypothetical protein